MSVVLSPAVRLLARLRVPHVLAALVTMLSFAGVLMAIVYAIAQPAVDWVDRAPSELRQLEYKMAWVKKPIANLRQAGKQVDVITGVGSGDQSDQADGRNGTKPAPQQSTPSFSLVDTVVQAAPPVVYGVAVTFVLLFFLLASGDSLMNKAVQISPTLTDKKRVVETGRGIQRHVSTYLGTITVINACVGLLVGLAMYLLHVPNPLLWGVMMGVLNYIPYIGVGFTIVVVSLVGLLTFQSPIDALWPPLTIFGISVVEGQFVTPIVAGRRLALSPVAVFLSLVVMGWIWGIVGVLIAVPLLAVVKLVCEELEPLHWLATLLSDA